jgi:hypothetical protein
MTQKRNIKSDSVSLNCYTIRFNKKNKGEFHKIKDVFSPRTFLEEMSEFMTFVKSNAYSNVAKNRILYLVSKLNLDENIFSGVMKRGHNGQESDIDELVGDKPNTVNSIKSDQYNSIYFYFLLCLPKPNSEYMIFMAQTYKQYGFKDLFTEAYKKYIFVKYGEEINVTINPLSLPKVFAKFIKEGDIRKLRFKKHSLPKFAENTLGENDNKNVKDYEVELSLRAKKQGFTGIKKIDFANVNLLELLDVGFDYDEAYADVSVNGRLRYINITHPEKFTATYDLSDRVNLDKVTKRPNYKELNSEALDILNTEIIINL